MKSSLSEHSLSQYSLVPRPHPLTSQQSSFFNENTLLYYFIGYSVELKSRLLTWHYLLKTLHSPDPFPRKRVGSGYEAICCIDCMGWLGVSWSTTDVIFGCLDKALHQWRSQNKTDARGQRGHTTFASSLVPRPRPASAPSCFCTPYCKRGSGGCSPRKFLNF